MARKYSRKAYPHRVLHDTGANAQRGADVKVLQRHTEARLDARGIDRDLNVDGVFGEKTRDAAKTASHFLGVPDEWHRSKSGVLVREQRIIIYPETRNAAMLNAARARMDHLQKERDKPKPDPGGGVSGLPATDRSRARVIATDAMNVLYKNRGSVRYTQGGSRWQGITGRRRFANGQFPTWADCSSSTTWALWNALTSVGGMDFRDIVNGQGWRAGYTGTMLMHGERVTSRLPGDLVIYGRGFPGKHVAMVAENTNMVYSHGSDSGPYYLAWNYRADVMCIRRYI